MGREVAVSGESAGGLVKCIQREDNVREHTIFGVAIYPIKSIERLRAKVKRGEHQLTWRESAPT